MNSTPADARQGRQSTQRLSIPCFLALVTAGLSGNYFHFSIFLNIDFLFGSIFALLAIDSRHDFAATDRATRSSLHQQSQVVTNRLSDWFQDRTRTLVALAQLAAKLTPEQMQARLEQALASDDNFKRRCSRRYRRFYIRGSRVMRVWWMCRVGTEIKTVEI